VTENACVFWSASFPTPACRLFVMGPPPGHFGVVPMFYVFELPRTGRLHAPDHFPPWRDVTRDPSPPLLPHRFGWSSFSRTSLLRLLCVTVARLKFSSFFSFCPTRVFTPGLSPSSFCLCWRQRFHPDGIFFPQLWGSPPPPKFCPCSTPPQCRFKHVFFVLPFPNL